MEKERIIKRATRLNIIEIAATIVLFITFTISNIFARAQKGSFAFYLFTIFVMAVVLIVSVVTIIMTIIMIKKSEEKIKGLNLLLFSGIVTAIFAISGYMAGIVVFLLSGYSLRQLKENESNADFRKLVKDAMREQAVNEVFDSGEADNE